MSENKLDINSMFVPLSIVIAGAVISGGLYFGLKEVNVGSTSTNSGAKVAGATDTVPTNDAAPTPTAGTPTTATVSMDDDPVWGDKSKAKVAVVEFSDIDCPYCKKFYSETAGQIKSNYIDKGGVILVHRDLPLVQLHPHAAQKAEAAECVAELKGDAAYYNYLDALYTGSIKDDEGLISLAEGQGVDKSKFEECLNSDRMASENDKDAQDANAIGIGGTPGFIVGKINADGTVTGDIIAGAYPYATFEAAINKYME